MKLYNKPNVLVFLPSIPEIKRVLEKVQEDKDFGDIKKKIDFQFEEFHGALTPMEKNKVIDPPESAKGSVRIILATNIAETAVTIDNIMYVLDSGREREYYQDELTSLSTQKEEKISKSSSIQRQGRAGRICSGYCYRMYTQEDFESFEDQKKPEILRMDISDLILLSIQLNDYFMMSDLLFFDKIEAKIMPIDRMLGTMKCYDFEDESKVLTPKGLFMIESSLQTSSAAFLYESLKLDNADYGYIATVILEKPTGYFRSNDSIRLLVEKEMKINNPLLTKLGDLAPYIFLVKEYDNLSKKTDMKKMYNIQESDLRRIKGDLTRLK
jgi:HrpA-like RNA helicase